MAPACSKSIVTSLRRERNAGTSFRRKMGYSATNPPGCRDLLGTHPELGRTSRAPQPIALLVRAPEETSGTTPRNLVRCTMAWTQAGAEFKLSSKLDPSASRRKLAYYSFPASLSGAARPVHGLQRRLPTPRRSVNLPKLGRGICSADGPISICRATFVWWWRANRCNDGFVRSGFGRRPLGASAAVLSIDGWPMEGFDAGGVVHGCFEWLRWSVAERVRAGIGGNLVALACGCPSFRGFTSTRVNLDRLP